MSTLLANMERMTEGVLRARTAPGAIRIEISSSGLYSDLGSYPGSMTLDTIPFKAV